MRVYTHIILGFGASLLVMALLGTSWWEAFYISILAAGIHPFIDRLSHSKKGRSVYRTRLLHSFETLVPLSASIGFIIGFPLGPPSALRASIAFMASALSHLVSDMMTPGGVYVWGRRVRLPLFAWDDPLANMGFSAIGMVMAVVGASILAP